MVIILNTQTGSSQVSVNEPILIQDVQKALILWKLALKTMQEELVHKIPTNA